MSNGHDASILTVFTTEGARTPDGAGLVNSLVERAREAGLAGASVLRGVEGFGHSKRVRTTRFPDAAVDLPIVVQIVDTNERIEDFLPALVAMTGDELVIRQPVGIDHWPSGPPEDTG